MESGLITDKKEFNKTRVKFGIGSILFQGEEASLGGVATVLIKMLGGNDLHIGIIGASSAICSMSQFLGQFMLRFKKTNRKAMQFILYFEVVMAAIIGISILASTTPNFVAYALWGYVISHVALNGLDGMMWNIESNWIGDLIPTNMLGKFSSYKWIITNIGILIFTYLIGYIGDNYPTAIGYSSIYFFFGFSFIIAYFVYAAIPDRKYKSVTLISTDKTEKSEEKKQLNYKDKVLWGYISFQSLWSVGRILQWTFLWAFLIEVYDFNLTKIAGLNIIKIISSFVVLFILGQVSDKTGHRKTLFLVTFGISLSMWLFVVTPWFGITPVIICLIINGAAGVTHTMLVTNYGIKIFPSRGRASYFGITRLIVGILSLIVPIVVGKLAVSLQDFNYVLWGGTIMRYHLIFILGSVITLFSSLPLLLNGEGNVKNR